MRGGWTVLFEVVADLCGKLSLEEEALRRGGPLCRVPRGSFLLPLHKASCLPTPSIKEWPCLGMFTTHALFYFLVKLCLLLGLPPSLPSKSLLLISISWNLGLKLNYNSAANTKSCRKKNTKKFNKKYINKKVQKRGGTVISFGVRWLQIQAL